MAAPVQFARSSILHGTDRSVEGDAGELRACTNASGCAAKELQRWSALQDGAETVRSPPREHCPKSLKEGRRALHWSAFIFVRTLHSYTTLDGSTDHSRE